MDRFIEEYESVKKPNDSYPDVLKKLTRSFDEEVAIQARDLLEDYAGL